MIGVTIQPKYRQNKPHLVGAVEDGIEVVLLLLEQAHREGLDQDKE